MASGFQNMTKIPELRRRLLYTLGLLAVYRIGVFVTTPGVNGAVMSKIVSQSAGSFLGLFNMFSGGALEKMSIFALGIMPYISSSIIIQLLTVVIPKLEQIQKEGEAGRRRINQYTRYGCVFLSLIQSYFIARWLISNNSAYGNLGEVVPDPGWSFYLLTMISLTTGTAFIMWLGEQITERGVGN
jgi:preprotein translocase subunit SecY